MNASRSVSYRIKPVSPEAHLFSVSCTVEEPMPEGQCFSLPSWIPGSYMIRDFAKNIVELWAETADGEVIAVEKLDKSTWRCEPCQQSVVLHYSVYAWDLSVRAAHLDITHGYFNGTSVFMAAHGLEDQSCHVVIEKPDGERYSDWRLATAMLEADDTERYSFGAYKAENYDELIDHPVEMGDFTLKTFVACGVPHDIVITGKHHCDMDRLSRDLKVICEHHIEFFGEPAPMDRYVFMTMVVGDGYGGLEHRASTSLLCNRDDLPYANESYDVVSDDYARYLGLCSHEYFHTWNVKRIKPEAYLPYALHEETYTEQLWAFEGITSYYDDLCLVRTGLISPKQYLSLVSQTMTRVLKGNGRLKQTVTESSFDTWTKFYKQDENAANAIVSYYAKGALVAMSLDFMIRQQTNDQKSLDDVMRALWSQYGQQQVGVPEDGIQSCVLDMVRGAAGQKAELVLQEFFQQALYSTDDWDIAALLKPTGVEQKLRAAESFQDVGGKPSKHSVDKLNQRPSLGLRYQHHVQGAKIGVAFEQGGALQAGMSAHDVIIAINNIQVSFKNIESVLAPYQAGDRVTVHAFRRDELMMFDVELLVEESTNCELLIANDGLSDFGKQWLGVSD